MKEAQIRRFEERDRTALRELFGRAGEGSPTQSLWGDEESEADVYLNPYMDSEPESLFVAMVDGMLVGYLTGCLDGSRFPSECDRMRGVIAKHRLMFRRKPAAFFARSMVDMATTAIRRQPTAGEVEDPRWPAHLHVNVLPQVRSGGVGQALMDRWLKRLRETDSPGCYLQTLVENIRAVRFFERVGFKKFARTPLVPGLRYQGRRVHQQTMVWSP